MSVLLIIRKFLLVLIVLLPFTGMAQLSLTTGLTATQIAGILAGPGVQISNATITSPSNYYSSFSAVGTNLGITSGILLTTGDNTVAIGPNNSPNAATIDNNPGDADLEAIANVPTYDAAVLEFDFIPQNDTIKFRYVFASEEYPEYVCSLYNDLFGFFISGPGFPVPQNIAIIPGTTTAVAINSVNIGTPGTYADSAANCNLAYPIYYIDNTNGATIQYDGFTTVLTAMAIVTPCQTYHLKIVVTDASDPNYDSGVFLEAGSLGTTPIVYAGADGTYCPGAVHPIGLSPISGWTYSWSPTTGISNPNIANPTVTLNNNSSVLTTSSYILTATNGTCILTDTVVFDIAPNPTATFTPLSNVCVGDTVTIQYTGNADATAYFNWNFGGATIISGNGAGPYTISYATPGKFITTLNVHYFNCPGTTIIDSVDVLTYPLANFSIPDSICQGEVINIQNTGTNAANFTYNWNFASANILTGTGAGPYSLLWNLSGNFLITLNITNSICVSNYSKSIFIKQKPIAAFNLPDSLCSNDTLQLLFNGTASPLVFFQWSYGSFNPIAGSGAGPITIVPTSTGLDSLRLIVIDHGCRDTAVSSINVIQQPLAAFSIPPSVCDGDSVSLNFTGITGGLSSFSWNVTSGSPSFYNSQGPFASQFNTPGIQNIILTVNTSGCIDTFSDSIEVNPLPIVQFTVGDVCDGVPVTINNQSTVSTGTIASVYWDYGDSQSSNTFQPITHLYNSSGNYDIKLIAVSDMNCKDSSAVMVTIHDLPVTKFYVDSTCEGIANTFIDSTSIATESISKWTYSNNGIILSNDSSFEYAFPTYGTYPIMLVTESTFGCRDTAYQSAIVHSNPTINISALPQNGCQPLDVAFQSFAQNSDGLISTTNWHFGDGDSAQTKDPQHIYEDAGLFSVSLSATSIFGCKSDSLFSDYIEVYEKPIAAFTNNPDPAEILSPVIYFTNQSSLAKNYIWDLGDGTITNDWDPVHQYSGINTYPIELIAISVNGCKDTAYGEVVINPSYTLYVPNSFTPNNDGKNDEFYCQGIGITNFKMYIFSRWGSPVTTITDLNQGWDGMYNGKEAPEDVYVYLIEATDVFNDVHTLTGKVTIVK